jgi:hypothetical protein
MGLYKVTRAFDVRLPLGLQGWQFAIAMGAAMILAPAVRLRGLLAPRVAGLFDRNIGVRR